MKFSKVIRFLITILFLHCIVTNLFSYTESDRFIINNKYKDSFCGISMSVLSTSIIVSNINGYTYENNTLYVQTEEDELPEVNVKTSGYSYQVEKRIDSCIEYTFIFYYGPVVFIPFIIDTNIRIKKQTLRIVVDNQKPVISGAFDVPGNKKGVVLPHCWPLLTATDSISGIAEGNFQYALSDEGPWSSVDSEDMELTEPGLYNVYFKATDHAGNESVEIVTVTVPDSTQSEYFILEAAHKLPKKSDDEFITYSETLVNYEGLWNTMTQNKLREITLSACDLIIKKGRSNGIYEKFNDHKDIKSITIYADTILIGSYLKLPQVDLKIYARELRFEENGCFDVSPNTDNFTESSDSLVKDGRAGFNGSTIKLYIGKLEHEGRTEKLPFKSDSELAWINPFSLSEMVKYINELYVNESYVDAYLLARSCAKQIKEIQSPVIWENLDSEWQMEFSIVQGDLSRIIDAINQGRNYFGNPIGWIPRLSNELSDSFVEYEIKYAFKMLYLNQWVTSNLKTSEDRIAGLKIQRKLLFDEIKKLHLAYKEATNSIPLLKAALTGISKKEKALQKKLDTIIASVIAQAEQNIISQDTLGELLMAANILSGFIKVMPSIDPGGGMSGSGLEILRSYNESQGFHGASISSVASIYSGIDGKIIEMGGSLDDFYVEFLELYNSLDQNSISQLDLEEMISVGSRLTTDIISFYDYFSSLSNESQKVIASEDKLVNAFECFLNEHPVYWPLKKEFGALVDEKKGLKYQLEDFLLIAQENSGKILANFKGIVDLSKTIEDETGNLNYSTKAFIEKRNKQAFDCLLKYYFYFRGVFEYNTLKSFKGQLNMQAILAEVEALVERTIDAKLTVADYDLLKHIYYDEIRSSQYNIIEDFQSSYSSRIQLNLSQEMLNRLNNRETITINPYEYGLFSLDEENIRITDIKINSDQLKYTVTGDYGNFCRMDLNIQHDGKSMVRKKGKPYIFRHYKKASESWLEWDNVIDVAANTISSTSPSVVDSSFIEIITGIQQNILRYFIMPGADSDFKMNLGIHKDNGDTDIHIDQLSLVFDYDFDYMNDFVTKNLVISNPDLDFSPFYELEFNNTNGDLYGRTSGYGTFNRTYIADSSSILKVSAPEAFGIYKFKEWIVYKGRGRVAFEWVTSPTVELTLDDHYTLEPIFVQTQDPENIDLTNQNMIQPNFSMVESPIPTNEPLSWFEKYGIIK